MTTSGLKIGFFTDLHARYDTPEGRTDDFRISLLGKLEEIGEIWKAAGVELVLFGGDLFHTPDPARSMEHDVMHILKSWQLPIVGVVGSHDYFGYQVKTLKRTAIGIFQKAGVIELVDKTKYFAFGGPGAQVVVVGTPHSYNLTDDVQNFYAERIARPEQIQIQLVHGDVVDKPAPWPHVLPSQIRTASDIVLCGHIHAGWHDTILIEHAGDGQTIWVNPGSIGRIDNGPQRIPRVCLIDVAHDLNFAIQYIPLTRALPHPFKAKGAEAEASTLPDITKLFHLIETTNVDIVDVKRQLPLVAKEAGFSERIVVKAFELLEEKA